MRIAHLSDLHVMALEAIPLRRLLFGKRATGFANLKLKRALQHDAAVVDRVLEDVREQNPEHVVITGDVSNLAFDEEFEAARELLVSKLQMDDERITIVPGNHDAYTKDAYRAGSFERVFARWMTSDAGTQQYPILRIRGEVAIVGLTSAVPRGAFVSSGEVGPRQLQELDRLIASTELRARMLLVLVHHPAAGMRGPSHVWIRGLRDAAPLLECVAKHPSALVAHGHMHRRMFNEVATKNGTVRVTGVVSASMRSSEPGRRGGYHLLDTTGERWRITERSVGMDCAKMEETLVAR